MEGSRLGRGAFVEREGIACIDPADVTPGHVVYMQPRTGETALDFQVWAYGRYLRPCARVWQVKWQDDGNETAYLRIIR